MIDSTNWSGVLSMDNLEDVAAAIAQRLEGRHYTFVEQNEYFGPDHRREREHQRLAPEQTTSGKAVSTWAEKHEGGKAYGGFNVSDTYGVWGASSFSDARITLTPGQIIVDQRTPAGHRTKWTIVPE